MGRSSRRQLRNRKKGGGPRTGITAQPSYRILPDTPEMSPDEINEFVEEIQDTAKGLGKKNVVAGAMEAAKNFIEEYPNDPANLTPAEVAAAADAPPQPPAFTVGGPVLPPDAIQTVAPRPADASLAPFTPAPKVTEYTQRQMDVTHGQFAADLAGKAGFKCHKDRPGHYGRTALGAVGSGGAWGLRNLVKKPGEVILKDALWDRAVMPLASGSKKYVWEKGIRPGDRAHRAGEWVKERPDAMEEWRAGVKASGAEKWADAGKWGAGVKASGAEKWAEAGRLVRGDQTEAQKKEFLDRVHAAGLNPEELERLLAAAQDAPTDQGDDVAALLPAGGSEGGGKKNKRNTRRKNTRKKNTRRKNTIRKNTRRKNTRRKNKTHKIRQSKRTRRR